MTPEKLKALRTVSDAQYQKELAKMQSIVAEENELRRDLRDLAEKEAAANESLVGDMAIRSLGADALWNSWIARNRKALNIKLANVLARKADAQRGLRRAFGKNSVIEKLHALEHAKAKSAAAKSHLAALEDRMWH